MLCTTKTHGRHDASPPTQYHPAEAKPVNSATQARPMDRPRPTKDTVIKRNRVVLANLALKLRKAYLLDRKTQ